ncbi:MAG: AarF/ABC1/UbiB kinase family protein [Opitutales bacterium]|nr:AarF/ABC1/UbiB kinase family protein [Opitutales bacterium]
MKPFSLYRDAVRAKEIVTVLMRHGFGSLLDQINIPASWFDRFAPRREDPHTPWTRIRMVLEDLGPTFIKIGQILTTRPDILPPALIDELKSLRDQVRPEPFESISRTLKNAFGDELEKVFSSIEPEPIGSGSIAQVHLARLRSTGETVAIKIQRPDIKPALTSDLEIIGWLARELHERVDTYRPYNLPAVVDTLRKGLLSELDFEQEARNATLFNARNPHPEKVFAPSVYKEISSRSVLVTEHVDGISPDEIDAPSDIRRSLVEYGGASVFHQMFSVGFFHADPHPGNILITPDHRICFLDWGMAGQLTKRMRHDLADLLAAVASSDVERIARRAIKMMDSNRMVDEQQLEMEITQVLDRYGGELNLDDAGSVILDLIFVFGSNGIDVARDYVLLAKAVLSLEKTGDALDPTFSIVSTATPFLTALTKERWAPESLFRNLVWKLEESLSCLNALPADSLRLIRRIENEDIGIRLHHRGLEDLNRTFNRSANRLVLAIIIGALIMGSSMVITTGVQPLLWGFPALGILGYLISMVFGFWIIVDIFRSGGHR